MVSWTVQEAMLATDEALRAGRSYADPTLPIAQWSALHDLEAERKEFEHRGDYYYVLRALRICCNHDLIAPDWLARAFIRAFDNVNQARAGSWDEVFGKPYSKGTHVSKIRERKTVGVKAYMRVKQLHETEQAPLDDTLFEKVGAEFGFGKTKASEFYYHWANFLRNFSKTSGNT